MAAKQPPATELTAEELREINRQAELKALKLLAKYVLKRLLLIPLAIFAFITLVVIGVSASQVAHALSGEHNIRRD